MTSTQNPTLRALVQAVLFIETDENDVPLDKNYTIDDVDEDDLKKLYLEYQEFLDKAEAQILDSISHDFESIDDFYLFHANNQNQTEYDYILTRCHEGCGFWDGDWDKRVSDLLTKLARHHSEINAYVENNVVYLY